MTKRIKFLIIAALFSLPFWFGINIIQANLENFFYAQISLPFETNSLLELPQKSPKEKPDLNVKSALLIKINSLGKEKVLLRNEADMPLAIASLTKLMTAVVLLEDDVQYNFSKILTISKQAANQENVPNYGNLKNGQRLSVKKMLELMLVYSSNDAAFAFSEVVGAQDFVAKMNQKARDLGLANTHFINPTGLDPEGLSFSSSTQNYFNYSSAKNLASLTKYILKNHPLIFEISSNGGPYAVANGISNITLPKNMRLLGGKTGYTDEAGGGMLIVLSDDKGRIFIDLILGALSAKDRVIEMQKLMDWI